MRPSRSVRRPRAHRTLRAPFVLLVAMLTSTGSTAHAARTTTFDTSMDGWLVTGDNTAAWGATGGNPDGCLYVNDTAIGAFNAAVAPLPYLGDWSAATVTDSIRYDVYTAIISGTPVAGTFTFEINGPGGSAKALVGYIPPLGVWTTIGIPLDPSVWTVTSGTWEGVLDHVTSLLLGAEFVNGREDTRIDNVVLTFDPVPVFEPCASDDFSDPDLGDWSFANTGGIENPGTGGNTGGYARLTDGTGFTYMYAPARFLGDWTSLDGNGVITFDLRLITRAAAPWDVIEFVRISGPGGSAYMSLLGSEVPASGLVWKNFTLPLQESAWTLTSGTWTGLLANVTECRLQLELVSGTETVGIDNFGRLAGGCAPIDDPVVVHDPAYENCGYRSLVGVGAVAKNPADGALYALLDLASGSGGGLYPLEGAGAGLRLQAYNLPAGLLYDADGHAYVSEDNGGSVFRYSNAGVSSVWASGFHAGDDDPTGMCFAPAGFSGPNVDPGDILVIDPGFSGPDELWSLKTALAESERQVTPDLAGDPNFRDITAGAFGVAYTVNTLDPNNLYVVTPDGVFTPRALSMPIDGMLSLSYSPFDARVYVASSTTGTIHRIDPTTGAVELVASGFLTLGDGAIDVDPRTWSLYVSDTGAGRVYELCTVTPTAVGDGAGGGVLGPMTSIVSGVRAWPNPARGAVTQVGFVLSREVPTRVAMYDLKGRLVRTVFDGRANAGEQIVVWDRRDETGHAVAAGVYFARVDAGGESRSARVLLLQ